jgi:hypothetical protein
MTLLEVIRPERKDGNAFDLLQNFLLSTAPLLRQTFAPLPDGETAVILHRRQR